MFKSSRRHAGPSRLRGMICAVLLALPVVPGALEAQDRQPLPQPLSGYVSDFANVLSPATEAQLTESLRDLRRSPGTEVAVVTLRAMSDYGYPDDIQSFAKILFNAWGIGDATRNDGILLLILTGDRQMRIALGSGYTPVWDNRAQRVVDAIMVPLLEQDRYDDATFQGLQGVRDYIIAPYTQGRDFIGTEDMPEPPDTASLRDFLIFLFFASGIGLMAMWNNRRRLGDKLAQYRPCPNCGQKGVQLDKQTDEAAGLRVIRRFCPACQWTEQRSEPAPAQNTDTDRDNDGFGGGSSSGGGASGRF